MKTLKPLIILLFCFQLSNAQPCQVSYIYSLSPNGSITFSNTTVSTNTSNMVFYWDLGTGITFTTTSLNQTVATTYSSNGLYNIGVTGTINSIGCTSSISSITNTIPGCNLFAADTCTSSAYGVSNVNFINRTTGTLSSTTYTWNFADGSTSFATNPSHTYNVNGVYIYTLYASNNATCNSHHELPLQNANARATDICSYTPAITSVTGPNGFVGYTISPVCLNCWHFLVGWNFGHGTGCNAFTNTTSTYYLNGTYTPTVQVISGFACVKDITTTIVITTNPGTVSTNYSYSITSPGVVQFSLTSAPTNTNAFFEWDFGDGYTSNLLNPVHTYTNAGNYSVLLIANLNSNYKCYINSTVQTLSITGIPCTAISNFSLYPNISQAHSYWIVPTYPYNVASALWSWGDGTTSNQLYAGHTYSAAGTYSVCLTLTTSCGSSSSYCINQYLAKGQGSAADMVTVSVKDPDKISGINKQQELSNQFEMYPNPSSGVLNINLINGFKPKQIVIYNLYGQKVFEEVLVDHQNLHSFNLNQLNNGIYILQFNSENSKYNMKFILSK